MSDAGSSDSIPWLSWPKIGVFCGISLLAVIYLHAQLTAGAAQALSFVLGIWGVFVTLIGLGIAIWQLQRSTSATKAAERAVQRLRSDVGALDIIAEIGSCRQEILSSISKLNEGQWKSACYHMTPVRQALIRITAVPGKFSEVDDEEFKNHVSYLISSETVLENIDNEDFDSYDMRLSLRNISDSLARFETILRDKFGEQ